MAVNTGRTVQLEKKKLRRRVVLNKILKGVVSFVLAFLVSGVSFDEGATGAGTAFVGASGYGVAGVFALAGACLGYMIRYGIENGSQYIASAVMVYTVAFVCQYLAFSRRVWFMPITVMLMIGMTTAFGTVATLRYELSYLVDLAAEIVLCGGLTFVYGKAMKVRRDRICCSAGEYYARVLLFGTICNALTGLELAGYVDLGEMVAAWLVMTAAFENEIPIAVSGAYLVGMLMGGQASMLYGLTTWAAKQFGFRSKALFLLFFIGSGGLVIGTTYPAREILSAFYTLCAGGILFLLYMGDSRYFSAITGLELNHSGERYFRLRESARLQQTAVALETVARQMTSGKPVERERDILLLMDRAMDSVCENCCKRHNCRSSQRVDMLYLFMSTAEDVARRGRMHESDIPDTFRERCYEYKSLVLAVNYELRHSSEEELRVHTAEESLRLSGLQFEIIGRVLRQMSGEIERFYGCAGREEMLVRRYLQRERLQCDVNAFYNASKRMTLQIVGKDVPNLVGRKGYLDELSQLLEMRLCASVSSRECLMLYEAEPLAATLGVASRRKQGEQVSGDQVKQFKTEQGILYVILSDGMGTGGYAWEQSGYVIACLEELLRSGMGAQSALELLNGMSYFRNREDWGYATVDLLELNLFTGEADIYKFGAADSYIFDGQSLHVLSGTSLPVGMETGDNVHPDHLSLRMKPGMMGLMLSDGIMPGSKEALERIFREENGNMKALSRRILTSERQSMGSDDMTVVAFSLEIRK